MARILVNNSLVLFPMGGMNLWAITWVVGLHRLGHDVYLIEDNAWNDKCFDNGQGVWSTDCTYGIGVVRDLVKRFGLEDRWSFIDFDGNYHGLPKAKVDELFQTADAFIDLEWGTSFYRTENIPLRVFIDNEPGWGQIKMALAREQGKEMRDYDYFYTIGMNVGTDACSVPTGGIDWKHLMTPVLLDHPPCYIDANEGRFTTVMNWHRSAKTYEYQGRIYGKKGIEFERFIGLPGLVSEALEVAVSGHPPLERLKDNGWVVRDANEVARSVDTFRNYVAGSKGEFSIAKNVFVETQCGWWGDRAGVYLSYGKPVVLQDAGFSRHIPCGQGLMAINTVDEAVAAIAEINADYKLHARKARELAEEYLDVEKVMSRFMEELNLQ